MKARLTKNVVLRRCTRDCTFQLSPNQQGLCCVLLHHVADSDDWQELLLLDVATLCEPWSCKIPVATTWLSTLTDHQQDSSSRRYLLCPASHLRLGLFILVLGVMHCTWQQNAESCKTEKASQQAFIHGGGHSAMLIPN